MKYKLINTKTKEETLCDKVTIDGFDYYVSDEHPSTFKWKDYTICKEELALRASYCDFCQKVIATNNPNIDIPKVVNEVEELAEKFIGCEYEDIEDNIDQIGYDSFIRGYNQALEDNKEKKYTEKDLLNAFIWGFMEGTERGDVTDSVNKFSQSLHPKTEWEVKIVDGKFKLKSFI